MKKLCLLMLKLNFFFEFFLFIYHLAGMLVGESVGRLNRFPLHLREGLAPLGRLALFIEILCDFQLAISSHQRIFKVIFDL